MREIEHAVHILVVEDVPVLRRITVQTLSGAGYRVTEAETGVDALRLARELHPDLLLLDVGLPDIDGMEICRRIKADAATASICVVLYSSTNTGTLEQAAGLEGGADGYIARPVSNRELLARIESILRLKRAEDRLQESETKFRALTEMTATAIFIVEPEGCILYANPAVALLTGYSPEEVVGMHVRRLIHPDDFDLVWERGQARLRGDAVPARYRFRVLTKSGETRWIDFTSALIYYLGEQAFLNTAYDVTDLIQAQEAEREQRVLAEALRDTAAALASPLGFNAMLHRILEVVGRIVPHDASNILLIEDGVARVACYCGYEGRRPTEALLAVRLPVDQVANLRKMAETGLPYAMPDTHSDPAWVDLPDTQWIRSHAGAPIRVGGDTIGFLSLDSAQPGFFTQAHAERLQAFANQAGMALENARLLDETQRRAAEFARLYEVTLDLSGQHHPPAILESITRHAAALLHASSAHALLYDAERNELELVVALGVDAPIGLRLAMGEGLAGVIAETRQPAWVDDYAAWSGRTAQVEGTPIGAMLAVPLLYSGDLIGVLGVSESQPVIRHLTEDDVRLLSLLAGQAAAAIHNARLYQAMQDELAERKHMQEELRQSESLYRLLAENSTDVIWKLDLQTLRFTYISPAVTRLRGLTVAEAMAETLDQAVDPQSLAYIRSMLPEYLRAFAEGDKSARNSVTVVRQPCQDGTWIDVEVATTLLIGEHGQPAEILGVSRDISARKQAEDEMHRSREMLRTVLDTIPQRVFWKDRNSVYLGANRPFAQDTGLSDPAAVVGKTDNELRWHKMAAQFQADDRRIVMTDTPRLAFEEVITEPDGSMRWQRTSKAPLHDAQGRVVGVLGTYEDITEQKEAQARRQALLDELARSNEELERFAYVVSHDLQEPLRMVASFVQLLGERYRGQLAADADDFIGFAVDGAQRMQQLINDLLEYSRVSSRGQPLQPTEATRAVKQAVRNLELAIEDAGATVTWDPLPTVMADDTQLMQVFQNLIGNAIKFRGEEPPQVHVSARLIPGEVARGADAFSSSAPSWLFAVRDNGIGIAAEYHARIFDVFQRLHTRDVYAGTGIGLAICKKIVERHGGRIWVESQPGHGATFFFTLPAGGGVL